MSATKTLFQINSAGFTRLAIDLDLAGRQTADAAWRTLGRWGVEFLRRVKEATPTAPGGGALRASWQIAEEHSTEQMSVTVGTSLRGAKGEPYALYLELGTARIADGAVKDWQPGEPPIELHGSSAQRDRPASLVRRSSSARLPILRPAGETIAVHAAAELRTAAASELSASLDGKHY